MAARRSHRDRVLHQRRADAEGAARGIDRERAEHQRRHGRRHRRATAAPCRPGGPGETPRTPGPRPAERPSRSRWQVRALRPAPKQASSSASRAGTSAARSVRMAKPASDSAATTSWVAILVMAILLPLLGQPTGRAARKRPTLVGRHRSAIGRAPRRRGAMSSMWRGGAGAPAPQQSDEAYAGVRCGRSATAGSR